MKRTEFRGGEWIFPFVMYSPEQPIGRVPLVVQLHGAGERGEGSLEKMDYHGFSQLLQSKEYNAIVVMPQCPTSDFWPVRAHSVIEFTEQIAETFPIDRKRISLCGISMGGFGTWYTAMLRPSMFSAIAPCCGGGMPWNAGVLDMPIYAIHGTADTTVKVSNTDDMVEALRAKGKDVTYLRLEGVAHNSWDHTFGEELFEWLISKTR